MRTNIETDDASIAEAMQVTGAVTKKAAVQKGLRRIVEHGRRLRAFNELEGIGWEGNLDEMRTSRLP